MLAIVGFVVEETVSAYGAAVGPEEIGLPVGSELSTTCCVTWEGRYVGLPV